MADTKQQLQKAKALIEQKRYEDAKAILITIDHPIADKWLDRLSKIGESQAKPVELVKTPKSMGRKIYTCVVYGLLAVICIPAGAMMFIDSQPKSDPGTPVSTARRIIQNELGQDRRIIFFEVEPSEPHIFVSYPMAENDGSYMVGFTEQEMLKIACGLKQGFPRHRLILEASITVIDGFGNEVDRDGYVASLKPSDISTINCNNIASNNLRAIADSYEIYLPLQNND
jgi:hypothetical protein